MFGKYASSPQLSRKTYSNQDFDRDTSPAVPNAVSTDKNRGTSPDKEHCGETQNNTDIVNDPSMSPVRITRIDSVDSVNDDHQENSNGDEVEIVCTNFSTEQPDVEIEIEQDVPSPSLQLRIAFVDKNVPDAEDLFDELMGSVPDTPLSTGNLSQALLPDVIPTSSLSTSEGYVIPAEPLTPLYQANGDFYNKSPVTPPEEFTNDCNEDDAATPKGSPYVSPATIRRWSVKKRPSFDQSDPDSQTTPKASPYIRRHKTVHHTNRSPKQYQEHYPSVSDPSSHFQDSKTQSIVNSEHGTSEVSQVLKPKSSVVRRHSFGSHAKRVIHLHQKQGSLSTDNTPQSSPRSRSKKTKKKSKTSPTASKQNSKADISLIGFVGSSRTELSLDNLQPVPVVSEQQSLNRMSFILPPPEEFRQPMVDEDPRNSPLDLTPDEVLPATRGMTADTSSGSVSSPQASSRKSLFNFHKPKSNNKKKHSQTIPPSEARTQSPEIIITPSDSETESTCVTGVPPCQSNPEELLSFDEILESFDRYADQTGNTNRGQAGRALSPQPKKKSRKKKRDRSMTVANIDAETMRQVKEEVARNETKRFLQVRDRSSSKVQQLAREYSQRIRENDKSRVHKRFSTVTEDSTHSDIVVTENKEPVWLQRLRERKTSTSPGADSDEHDDVHRNVMSDNELHCQSRETEQTTKRRAQTMKLTSSLDAAGLRSTKHQTDRLEELGVGTEHDQQRKGKFRGWVRSLVDRFSTSKEKN